MHLLVVDPGDVHNGVAFMFLGEETRTLNRLWTRTWRQETLYSHLEQVPVSTHVACESYHLYPELARQQGYSTFPTCERIGAVKYICAKRGLSLTMQEPSVKRQGRRIGERLQPALGRVRVISSARGNYRGWDWDATNQHERDATSHGAYFAFRNKTSPLHELDLKRQARLVWLAQ